MPPHGAPGDKGEALKAVESRSPGDTLYSGTVQNNLFNWVFNQNTRKQNTVSTKRLFQMVGKHLDSSMNLNRSVYKGVRMWIVYNDIVIVVLMHTL